MDRLYIRVIWRTQYYGLSLGEFWQERRKTQGYLLLLLKNGIEESNTSQYLLNNTSENKIKYKYKFLVSKT